MIKNWRWFISKRLREAVEDRNQIIKLLAAQRDLIKPVKIDELEQALSELEEQYQGPINKEALQGARKNTLDMADRVLIVYPNASYRDWVEMFLVVAALVLAFRTFFFQPFKIPTGSMQPTLYGITVENLMDQFTENVTGRVEDGMFMVDDDDFFLRTEKGEPIYRSYNGRKKLANLQGHTVTFKDGQKATISKIIVSNRVKKEDQNTTISKNLVSNTAKIEPSMKTKFIEDQPFSISFEKWPDKLGYIIEKLRGYTYHSMKAEGNWKLLEIQELKTIAPFISKQILVFSDSDSGETINRTAWFPPLDSYQKSVLSDPDDKYNLATIGTEYKKEDFIYRLRVKTGDHLFVNRMTYNFRHPRRGDISVFTIKSSDVTHGHTGLPTNDTFYIKRLVGLGKEEISIGLDRHVRVNDRRLNSGDNGFEFVYNHRKTLTIYKPIISIYSGHDREGLLGEGNSFTIPANHYLFFGDNTANSMDSRSWGALPKNNVIGHSSFVYWPPLSSRFGWSHR